MSYGKTRVIEYPVLAKLIDGEINCTIKTKSSDLGIKLTKPLKKEVLDKWRENTVTITIKDGLAFIKDTDYWVKEEDLIEEEA